MSTRLRLALAMLAVVLYAACIVLANYLTSRYGLWPMGFGLVATAGTYAAGLVFLARDAVQRLAGVPATLAAMALGVWLSFMLADPRVALASAVAFGFAELVDFAVFTPIEPHGWGWAALASNLCSTPADTFVFLWVAGFPVTAAAVCGQLVGKLLWGTLLVLAVYAAARWLLARQRVAVAA